MQRVGSGTHLYDALTLHCAQLNSIFNKGFDIIIECKLQTKVELQLQTAAARRRNLFFIIKNILASA